jgi:hypothetical protein
VRVFAVVLGACLLAASARAEGLVQRDTEGPSALRSPTETAIARDAATPTPLRLGDYFLFGRVGPEGTSPSGLRFSSGLFGPQRPFTLFESPLDTPPAQPYLGLGYSRAWMKSQLSVNADVGMTSPGGGSMRLRSVMGGNQTLDEAVRDLRWSPVMAVNVKYAF